MTVLVRNGRVTWKLVIGIQEKGRDKLRYQFGRGVVTLLEKGKLAVDREGGDERKRSTCAIIVE